MKNICFITTTRADYGLLKPLMLLIRDSEDFKLTLFVTGTHLSSKFGDSYKEIEKDFKITKKIDSNFDSDSSVATCKTMGLLQILFSESISEQNAIDPIDMVVILGDRFEVLAITQVCFIQRLKLCHISGGDVTEGAIDNAFRNSISQMSNYHLVTCEKSKDNLLQMGIRRENIEILGNPGLEELSEFKPSISADRLFEKYDLIDKFEGTANKYILILFHPETLRDDSEYINKFFSSVKKSKFKKVIIKPNCDPKYEKIIDQIDNSFIIINNLPRYDFLSLAYYCNYYIGNSSSGLYELPFLRIPIINVGNRQKGRIASMNVINVDFDEIDNAIFNLEEEDFYNNKIFKNQCCAYSVMKSKEIFIRFLKERFKEETTMYSNED